MAMIIPQKKKVLEDLSLHIYKEEMQEIRAKLKRENAYIYIYIYIEREREREFELKRKK